jgi:hypothetical protein
VTGDVLDPVESGGVAPVRWPEGYTARRTLGGEVEVLNKQGEVVATTGRKYSLAGCFYQIEGSWSACYATESTADPPLATSRH